MLLNGVIFQFRSQISKIVAGHFEKHTKLGRFHIFLATGGLRNPKRRLFRECLDSRFLNPQFKFNILIKI